MGESMDLSYMAFIVLKYFPSIMVDSVEVMVDVVVVGSVEMLVTSVVGSVEVMMFFVMNSLEVV